VQKIELHANNLNRCAHKVYDSGQVEQLKFAKHMHTQNSFHGELRKVIDEYVHKIYDLAKLFPKDEMFGLTSQLKRAALSVPLNYVEGYARQRKATHKHFLEIAYGSLKESMYLIEFSFKRGYLPEKEYNTLMELSDRIGKMLWGVFSKIDVPRYKL
jgi:four helix bundle protein